MADNIATGSSQQYHAPGSDNPTHSSSQHEMGIEACLPRSWGQGIVCITSKTLQALTPAEARSVGAAIDEMGVRSAKAQGLPKPITTFSQMRSCDNRLYMAVGRRSVRGIIRVGRRQLFIRRRADSDYTQISPTCVLDFYVHESCQRSGQGHALYAHMLREESIEPRMLGYDRPSFKFQSFLRRHYGLSSFTPQSNNFVVFDDYWNPRTSGSQLQQPSNRFSAHASQQQQPLPIQAPAFAPSAAEAPGFAPSAALMGAASESSRSRGFIQSEAEVARSRRTFVSLNHRDAVGALLSQEQSWSAPSREQEEQRQQLSSLQLHQEGTPLSRSGSGSGRMPSRLREQVALGSSVSQAPPHGPGSLTKMQQELVASPAAAPLGSCAGASGGVKQGGATVPKMAMGIAGPIGCCYPPASHYSVSTVLGCGGGAAAQTDPRMKYQSQQTSRLMRRPF